jgi:hypothetical protein
MVDDIANMASRKEDVEKMIEYGEKNKISKLDMVDQIRDYCKTRTNRIRDITSKA